MAEEILIVDDEEDIRRLVAGTLEDEGYRTLAAADGDEALAVLRESAPSLALLDVWLEGSRLDGMELLEVLRGRHPELPVLMISGHGTIETAVRAIREGAYDFVEKPFNTDRLLNLVARAIEAARLRRENAELRLRAGVHSELVGRSQEIGHVRALVERVAPTGSRVLIQGPPGSGKEVVARLIHLRSRRSGGPFVVVNCATMIPDRFEEHLFGTEGGGRTGFFEQADGGTLLLDEVVDMPLETQGKIVRVLQEQTFQRVGGSRRIRVDVRVVASSNRDLAAQIAEGNLREDLFYRLNVVPVEIAPLHRRREDIPLLVEHFSMLFARQNGIPGPAIAEDAMAALQAYGWPGNVRELRNVVERLSITGPGDGRAAIRADALPPELREAAPAVSHFEKGDEMMAKPLREAREVFEREYLLTHLNRLGGNISRTAEFVGMERSALHRKLKLLGVHIGAERAV